MPHGREPQDVAELLRMVVDEGANAAVCPDEANVADFIWLGDGALRALDEHTERLTEAAPSRKRVPDFQHAAYVRADGSLMVVGRTPYGVFVFMVAPGEWGWTRRLM
jgi:hypothetical protein